MILRINLARLDVGDGSAITSIYNSEGTPSARGALLFGVSASAPMISDYSIVLPNSGFYDFARCIQRDEPIRLIPNGID
ncbi:hypothetical protein AYI70_g2867 [Smittium culicis]|uniref:Uncharacterized protein n=1 Tax=Smittium culicis TaxID=133412 RepID=A0A1R1Y6B6_9FUNG|nr:hypothetical protein AYI70_g2867 [Smittium culicis]